MEAMNGESMTGSRFFVVVFVLVFFGGGRGRGKASMAPKIEIFKQ